MSLADFRGSLKAAEQAGIHARAWWLDGATFRAQLAEIEKWLARDPGCWVSMTIGWDQERQQTTLWHVVHDATGTPVYAANISLPCPPNFPPSGPPCP